MSGESELPAITATSIHGDAFPNELVIRVGSFWTGKEFSSYLLAAESSRVLREGALIPISEGIMTALRERCADHLESMGAPDVMKQTWKGQSDAARRDLDALRCLARYVESVSCWCAFLDYIELIPYRLSKETLQQEEPIHALWIIGTGNFGGRSEAAPHISPAMLSVPTSVWRPELVFLADRWLVDFIERHPLLTHAFPMAVEQMVQNIDSSVAILSWKDPKYLEVMHKSVDIEAGMLVYHQYGERGDIMDNTFVEGSYLNWLPRAWCALYPIRGALERSDELKWLCKGTRYDKNMLASFEINDATIPSDHMEGFGQRIVKLMKEVEKWY